MPRVREVAFQLECFEWAEDRLDVAGRWQGLAGRRLGRPVLTVMTTAGKRKRLVAMANGRFGATESTWRAEFAWPGDPGEITGAELEVGGNVVVDLPLPDKRRRRRRKPAGDVDEALHAEVVALRGQVDRLRTELAGREREIMRLRAEVDEETGEEHGVAGPEARTVDIEGLARAQAAAEAERDDAREQMTAAIERIERERSDADAERARAQADVDDLREAFAEAAAEVEAVRERHREELARLTDALEAERAEVARLRAAEAEAAARVDDDDGAVAPPLSEGARERAAGPPTEPLAARDRPVEAEPTTAAEAPLTATHPVGLDPPGPMRAGARPAVPDGAEEQEEAPSRIPAWLRAARARAVGSEPEDAEVSSDRNGQAPAAEPVPPPLRTAAAARARAGATVAARRSPLELWVMRIVAAIFVVLMLVAFVVILNHVA
jgi:hypothetical protein